MVEHHLLTNPIAQDQPLSYTLRQYLKWLFTGGMHSPLHLIRVLISLGHDEFASFQQGCALQFTTLILDRFLEENPSLKGEFTHILKDAKCCKSCKTKTFGPSCPSAYMNLHIKENEGFNNVMERLLGASELDDFACSTCQEKTKPK